MTAPPVAVCHAACNEGIVGGDAHDFVHTELFENRNVPGKPWEVIRRARGRERTGEPKESNLALREEGCEGEVFQLILCVEFAEGEVGDCAPDGEPVLLVVGRWLIAASLGGHCLSGQKFTKHKYFGRL